jgi:RNA polymerase sigma-70 factor (family 1)
MYNSEKRLLEEVAAGNEHAFQQLFYQYHEHLGKHVFYITQSHELTEEIVQDVFLKIWLNKEALIEIKNLKAYLFVLSKNHTLNFLRKLGKELLLKKKWEEDFLNMRTSDNIPENTYYRLLDEAIDHLPSQQQKVYLLSRHQRLKQSEIARKLNLSKETVKSYLKIATTSITAYISSHQKFFISLFALVFAKI